MSISIRYYYVILCRAPSPNPGCLQLFSKCARVWYTQKLSPVLLYTYIIIGYLLFGIVNKFSSYGLNNKLGTYNNNIKFLLRVYVNYPRE